MLTCVTRRLISTSGEEPVSLEGAILKNADLTCANLERANLKDADLTGASLSNTDLRGANLDAAILTKEQIAKAKVDDKTQLPDNLQPPAS
jgi:uncharacterized protein YjbI with pentapeptide repeats